MNAGLAAALVLALVHVLAGKLHIVEAIPRSRWLSLAGGISVAYVFAHLLPDLAEAQERLRESTGAIAPRLDDHAYLLALAGLVLFYGVERMTVHSRSEQREREGRDAAGESAFRVSMGLFALYTGVIGYALDRQAAEGTRALVLFALAMGVHFLVNDAGLREHHKEAYAHLGRWLLAGSVLLGWLLSQVGALPEAGVLAALAFLAGGLVLNVLKEELPERSQSRFSAFAFGAAGYALLLQLV